MVSSCLTNTFYKGSYSNIYFRYQLNSKVSIYSQATDVLQQHLQAVRTASLYVLKYHQRWGFCIVNLLLEFTVWNKTLCCLQGFCIICIRKISHIKCWYTFPGINRFFLPFLSFPFPRKEIVNQTNTAGYHWTFWDPKQPRCNILQGCRQLLWWHKNRPE